MPRFCVLCGKKDKEGILYSFPNDETLKQKWCEALNFDVNKVRALTKVCNKHFLSSQMVNIRLTKHAVPCLHLQDTKIGMIVRENEELRRRVEHLESTQLLDKLIDDKPISNPAKLFCKMLLRNKNSYTKEEKELSALIKLKSPATYQFLRNNLKFCLPTEATLSSKGASSTDVPEDKEIALVQCPKEEVKLPIVQKVVSLAFNEIVIKQEFEEESDYGA